jgi:hypothetical protein
MSDVHYICCPCIDCCNEKKHSRYKEVVGCDDDVDEMNHSWTEQNMAREDTDVHDDVDQTSHCRMK